MPSSYQERYYRTQRARRKGSRRTSAQPIKTRPRSNALTPQEYEAYMRSTEWANRKASYFQTHVRVCVVCGIDQKIHLHHLTYERLGQELDDDFRALCERHHAAAHEHHKLFGGTLREATLLFIRRMHET